MVNDLDAAVKKYTGVLGSEAKILPADYYAYPGLIGARLSVGGTDISLVSPTRPGTPVSTFLARKGEGVNHISLQVDDLEESMRDWHEKGVEFTSAKPLPFPEGRVVFAHPRSLHGVQIALVQLGSGELP